MIKTTTKKELRIKMSRCSYSDKISVTLLRRRDIAGYENWDFVCSFAEVELEQTGKELSIYSHISSDITRNGLELRHYVTYFNMDSVDLLDSTDGYYKNFYKNNTPEVELPIWTLDGDVAVQQNNSKN